MAVTKYKDPKTGEVQIVGVPTKGFATLDETGKVPAEQLPEMNYVPDEFVGLTNTDILAWANAYAGNYVLAGGNTDITNVPYSGHWFFDLLKTDDGGWCRLTATDLFTRDVFVNTYNYGTWYGWKVPGYTYGTTDMTAGASILANGTLYFVYE